MESDINILKEKINSDDWQTSLSAADRLADIGTEKAGQLLLDTLKSNDHLKRNAAAFGLMRTKNQKYFAP